MLLETSPLTSIYFTTFEKKRKVRSLTHNQNFLIFGIIYITFYSYIGNGIEGLLEVCKDVILCRTNAFYANQ